MPDRLQLAPGVRDALDAMPEEVRRAAAALLMLLLTEPVPDQAVPDPDIKNGYRINASLVTVFYGTWPDEIRVFLIRQDT